MDKTFLITGVTSDLAAAFLRQLNKCADASGEKYLVYGTYYKNSDMACGLQKEFSNIEIKAIPCNLGDEDEIRNLINYMQENVPSVFIHLAASKIEYMRLRDFDWNKTKEELDIQIGSFALLCKWLLPQMAKEKSCRIVAVGSSYTFGVPPKYMSDYILCKYALYGLVKAVASEYSGKNITCNMVSPDMMETKFLSNLDRRTAEINAKQSAMKRNVTVDEAASGIMYLISEQAGYINGINLNISGGSFM
jgi:3-oxoacyl-[acyl-carrier protein] reductase